MKHPDWTMIDMTDNDPIFDEQFALEIKEGLSSLRDPHLEFYETIKHRLPPDIRKLVLRKIVRSNYDVYHFFCELVAVDIGNDAAEEIFSGKRKQAGAPPGDGAV